MFTSSDDNFTKPTMSESKLTKSDQARIERNRQRALLLKSAAVAKRLEGQQSNSIQLEGSSRALDTGGGFLLEFDDLTDEQLTVLPIENVTYEDDIDISSTHTCQDCNNVFNDSFLLKRFDAKICDGCKGQNDGKNGLITKTDAKANYLLKDYDFENRGATLKFISKKNPHNPFSGEMRLFFKPQVVDLAQAVWGTLDKLEEEKKIRKAKSEKMRHKKLEKRVKELRRAVRTSTWHKETKTHQHVYGDEKYDDTSGMFTKHCQSCDHFIEFEKM